MTKSLKIFIGLSLISLTMMLSYLFFWDQSLFVFKNLELSVQGETWHPQLLQDHQKKWSVRLLAHKNKNLWHVPLKTMNADLLQDPSVLSVSVERVWPQGVRIQIRLKPILFVFFEGKKTVRPITEDGHLLSSIAIALAPDVPFVRNRELIKKSESLKTMISLFLLIPDEGSISKVEVAEVDWNLSSGLMLEMSSGVEGQIVLGHKDVTNKCKRVANVLKYLESQNQRWRVIDASFAKKVLVRLRKHS
jgi:cell division septal protein FtsQ